LAPDFATIIRHSGRVQTVSLTWPHAGELAGALAVSSVVMRAVPRRHFRWLAPFLLEAAILAALYAMWILAGDWASTGSAGAFRRAHWIMHAEHDLLLPSERSVQDLILGHPLLVQAANLYYDTMHFTMMFVFLLWLFVRHRDRYRPVRATMAWTTLACLLVQLVPVAPPRMIKGFVDTALVYNQSVYSNGLAADQLSAMPSVHVAWAIVVGYYAVTISTSRWRWIAAAHATLTVFVVLATANHWWLDGIVATGLLVACAWLRYGAAHGARALLRRAGAGRAEPAAEPVPAG
jgi:hypothetical protein